MEAAAEPHRQRRAQPAEPRNHPGHRLLAEGVPRRRGTRAAAVSRHAPLLAHAHQVARRDRGGDPRPAPAAAVRADEVRHVEPRVPLPRRRARGALDAAPRAALPGAGGASLMHDDWVRQIEQELDGELSLPERAALARHLAGCRHCAEARISHLEMRVAFARSAGEPHARTVPRPAIRGRILGLWMAISLIAGVAAGWFAHVRWGGPGAASLEATRATFVAPERAGGGAARRAPRRA